MMHLVAHPVGIIDVMRRCARIIPNCAWDMLPSSLPRLHNTALGLLARQGVTNVAQARREFTYQFDKALHLLAS
jgi:hypothetical protein